MRLSANKLTEVMSCDAVDYSSAANAFFNVMHAFLMRRVTNALFVSGTVRFVY